MIYYLEPTPLLSSHLECSPKKAVPVLECRIDSSQVINCSAHEIEPEGFALPPLPEELQVRMELMELWNVEGGESLII